MILKTPFSIISSAFAFIILTGCGSTPTYQLPKVSEIDAFKALNQHKTIAESNITKHIEDAKDAEVYIKKTTHFVQPQNKTEECKLWFAGDSWPDNLEVYWDGGCKNGHAYGLGREFVKFMTPDVIFDIEKLAYYAGNKSKPIYLTRFDRVSNDFILKAYGSESSNGIHKQLVVDDNETQISTQVMAFGETNTDDGYGYVLGLSSIDSGYKLFVRSAGKNNSILFKQWEQDNLPPTTSAFTVSDGIYEATRYFNGNVIHKEIGSQEHVSLPNSYTKKVMEIYSTTQKVINEVIEKTQKSEQMFAYYLTQICNEETQVDFMPQNKYKQICGQGNYFSDHLADVEETRQKYIAKRKSQFEQWLVQQDYAKQERHRQQMLAAAQKQAEAAEEANNINSWQSINSSLSNLNNSLSQTLNSYNPADYTKKKKKNKTTTTYSSIGNSIVGSDGTTCSKVGNSVVCY
jgi:hypothetical protein